MRPFYFVCTLISALVTAQPGLARAADSRANALITEEQAMYAVAVEAFRQHRYAAAYGRFARLADAGDLPSAQLALVMYRNGPLLFGSRWDASTEQLERWSAMVVKSESASARMDLARTR